MILITKDDCPNCDFVKKKIADEIDGIEVVNADEVQGKVYMAYYQIFGKMEMDSKFQFPFLITEKEDVVHGTIAIKNHILKRSDG